MTRHSFSFGDHYDPGNVGFGPLMALNDESVAPGEGYPDHPHAEVEIVTWVLDGVLRHRSSVGAGAALDAGTVQVQSTGSGLVHSEIGDPASGPTRFVQTWLRPEVAGTPPAPARAVRVPDGGLSPVVGGAGLPIGAAATLWVGEVTGAVVWPDAPRLHALVVAGELTLRGLSLGAGDAVRLIEDQPPAVASAPVRLMVWALPG